MFYFRLEVHNKPCVVWRDLQYNINKEWIEIFNLPLFSYGYQKCMFANFGIEYTSPPKLCSLLTMKYLIKLEDSPIPFNDVLIELHTNKM